MKEYFISSHWCYTNCIWTPDRSFRRVKSMNFSFTKQQCLTTNDDVTSGVWNLNYWNSYTPGCSFTYRIFRHNTWLALVPDNEKSCKHWNSAPNFAYRFFRAYSTRFEGSELSLSTFAPLSDLVSMTTKNSVISFFRFRKKYQIRAISHIYDIV